jgi:uncharacterized protein YbcV (DUF1398 family)
MKRVVVLGFTLMFVVTAQAGLYRWVDDAGNVHFSDKVPVAASKKSHSELSKTGDVTKTVVPESKQHEIEALALASKEKEQLEEIKRIKREAYEVIQQRDDNLLSTYENKDELIRYYKTKIKMVEGNTKILQAQNRVLNKKVVKLEDKVTTTTHKETLKSISRKIVNINKTIEQYKKALIENSNQIETLTTNFNNDLERYVELTK